MVRPLRPLLGLLAGLLAGATGTAADYDYFLTGDARDVRPEKTEGALLLMGGSTDVEAAFRWFVGKAGGGDIVVLRASGGDGYNNFIFSKIGGVNSVETVLFHNRAAATDPRVLEIIRNAEGIWLAGGDQGKYVSYWKNTPVAAALDAHVRAGKPLGGTSAGLAVLGEFAFSALGDGSLTSAIALAAPHDPRITIEHDFLHLALLRGVITDTHFMARGRMGRSLVFLARILAETKRDRIIGIGVDEKTALALEADGTGRVFTTAKEGRAWIMVAGKPGESLASGQPLTLHDVRVTALGPESRIALPTLDVQQPAMTSVVSVVDGQLSPLP